MSFNVAVVGATGMVGQAMLDVLSERKFPVKTLLPLASENSQGKTVRFQGKDIPVQTLTKSSFVGIDLALFSAGGDVSLEFAPLAAAAGCYVIDNSSAFRMHAECPLVVPEVNPEDLGLASKSKIIANPNCSTIQMLVALAPLHRVAQIKRIVVSTYQSVSGAGLAAYRELEAQTKAFVQGEPLAVEVFPHQIAFNCLPQIDSFLPDGYTKEEMKMVNETRKMLHDESIQVSPTAVRVPVFVGHAESVNVEFAKALSVAEARDILCKSPGVQMIDDVTQQQYPLASSAAGKDPVFVGRLRADPAVKHGLALWIVADNIRKGAALNAVQIAECLIQQGLLA